MKVRQLNRKSDAMRGQITAHTGDLITIKLIDPLDVETVKKQAINGKYYVTVDVFEKDSITDEQRRHFLALCGDISEYEGVPVDAVQAKMKYDFMKDEDLTEFPSIARNQMKKTTASKLIEFVILHCIHNQIPFRKQQFYLTIDQNKMLYALLMEKICWSCGSPNAQLAHYDAVGMGRDRNKIDHTQHRFMRLCWKCHAKQHAIGEEEYCKLNHFKPIKLSKEDLQKLKIRGDYTQ